AIEKLLGAPIEGLESDGSQPPSRPKAEKPEPAKGKKPEKPAQKPAAKAPKSERKAEKPQKGAPKSKSGGDPAWNGPLPDFLSVSAS
ncbi:MAG: hypothetical protein ACLGHC_11240, partial [Alphaproteobacteria bacterium]